MLIKNKILDMVKLGYQYKFKSLNIQFEYFNTISDKTLTVFKDHF